MPIDVTDADFEQQVLQSDRPVLVDLHATWCGPCRTLGPRVAQFAAQTDQVKVVKVDVDQAPRVARDLGVMSVPTLLLFKDGEVVARHVGVPTVDALREFALQ